MESSINKTLSELPHHFEDSLPLRKTRTNQKAWPGFSASFAIVGAILQQPTQFFSEIREVVNLPSKIMALFISSTVFLAIYGAVLGLGYIYLSVDAVFDIPFLFLGSLVACIPVMYLLDVLTGSQRSLSQLIAVLLTSVAASATVFFSFAPIMIVFRLTGTTLQFFGLNVGIMALATLVGLIYVTQGLIQTAIVDKSHAMWRVNRQLHFLWMLLFLMVISQLGWSMLAFFERTGGFLALLI